MELSIWITPLVLLVLSLLLWATTLLDRVAAVPESRSAEYPRS